MEWGEVGEMEMGGSDPSGMEEECALPGEQQGEVVDSVLDLELWSLFGVRNYMCEVH